MVYHKSLDVLFIFVKNAKIVLFLKILKIKLENTDDNSNM